MTKEEIREVVIEMFKDGTISFSLNDKRDFYSDYLEVQLLMGIDGNTPEVISYVDIKINNT